jgi:hypothetical protein
MKMIAFWDTAPCNLFVVDRRFRDLYCLHQDDDSPEDGGGTHLWNVGILRYRRLLSSLSEEIHSLFLKLRGWGSSVSMVSEYRLDNRCSISGRGRGRGFFPVVSVSIPALRPTQPPMQWIPLFLSLGKALPGRDHSPPSSADVKIDYSDFNVQLRPLTTQ